MVRFKKVWEVYKYINKKPGLDKIQIASDLGFSVRKVMKILTKLFSDKMIYGQHQKIYPVEGRDLLKLDKEQENEPIIIGELFCKKCHSLLERVSGDWWVKCSKCGTQYNFVYNQDGSFKYMHEV